MDRIAENIIAIRKRDISKANEAFAEFMKMAERNLNDKAKCDPNLYKDCVGTKMEPIALTALREIAPSTPFRPEEINLVSGAKFPDIQAEHFYGVEVKTTQKNTWKSLGGSIVESTRIKDVESIFMLFAKLGGEYAEFRCKPYEDCLEDFGITHQPRYRIDMEIQEKRKETIFQKMGIDYDSFRTKDEEEKNAIYHRFKQTAENTGVEMAWRLTSEDGDYSMPMTISFLNDKTEEERIKIRARMFVLFPEVFSASPSIKYKRAALWLCSRNGLICTNMRDIFSSGGQVNRIGYKTFEKSVSKIFLRLYQCREEINSLFANPDKELLEDIDEFWTLKCQGYLLKSYWLEMVQNTICKNKHLYNVSVSELIDKW